MIDRLEYWKSARGEAREQQGDFLDASLAASIDLPRAEVAKIQDLVWAIVARSFLGRSRSHDGHESVTPPALLESLNHTTRFSINVPRNLDGLVSLESAIVACMRQFGLLRGIKGMQFPVDVRVVHPEAPAGYLERRDAVDYLHCDPWRGEPADVVNCVLYCWVSEDTSQLELYNIGPAELAPFAAYHGDERFAAHLVFGRRPMRFEHRVGQLILFDAFLPHRTNRQGGCVRISVNFSLRRADPYDVLDERWDRARQPWHKYWYVGLSAAATFAERCSRELERLSESGRGRAIEWRLAAIRKHFGVRVGAWRQSCMRGD